jgi:hypothetical protein
MLIVIVFLPAAVRRGAVLGGLHHDYWLEKLAA